MKLFILLFLLPSIVMAECEWKSIERTEQGFLYSAECHQRVGKMVKDEKLREEQVEELNQTIKLKDLALDTNVQRADLWRKTSFDLEDRLFKIENNNERNKWIYFGLGFLGASLAVWGASRLNK